MTLDRQTAADMEFVARIGAPQGVNAIKNISNLIFILLGWVSVTVEVFTRHGFGERYLTPLRCIMAWMALRVFLWFPNIERYFRSYLNPFAGEEPFLIAQAGNLFANAFILMCVVHLIRIWVRNNVEGKSWHSFSFGISNLDLLIPWLERLPGVRQGGGDWLLYRIIEPVLVLFFAWIVYKFNGVMGWWFYLGGIALFLRNNLVYSNERSRYLDILDARIESHYFNQLQEMQGGNYRSKRETAGYSVVPVPPRILKELRATDIEATVAEMMGSVTPSEGVLTAVPAIQPPQQSDSSRS